MFNKKTIQQNTFNIQHKLCSTKNCSTFKKKYGQQNPTRYFYLIWSLNYTRITAPSRLDISLIMESMLFMRGSRGSAKLQEES